MARSNMLFTKETSTIPHVNTTLTLSIPLRGWGKLMPNLGELRVAFQAIIIDKWAIQKREGSYWPKGGRCRSNHLEPGSQNNPFIEAIEGSHQQAQLVLVHLAKRAAGWVYNSGKNSTGQVHQWLQCTEGNNQGREGWPQYNPHASPSRRTSSPR